MGKRLHPEEKKRRGEKRKKERKDRLFSIFKTQNLSYNTPIQKIIDIDKEVRVSPTIVFGYLLNFCKQDPTGSSSKENDDKKEKRLEAEIAALETQL